MTEAPSPLHPDTRAVHVEPPAMPGSTPVGVPIYQTSTFALSNPDLMAEAMTRADGAFNYSRLGNPTVRALEAALADLEGGAAALVTSAGMGAINAVLLSLLRAGDHVIAQSCVYGGTFAMLRHLHERFGVEVTYVGGDDVEEVRRAMRPATRLLYLETIANPMTQVADLPVVIPVARDAGVTVVVDNTFASPVLCRPLEYGADIVVHSTTKYIGGHSDVTGGVAIFARADDHQAVWKQASELGVTADPIAAWLTIRGLATLSLRVRRQCENAEFLVHRLVEHRAVSAVHWPGLDSHPNHAVATKVLAGYGGVFSFDLTGGREAGRRFVTELRLARLAASLGGTVTLVLHPASTTHRQLGPDELRAAGIGEGTIRVAVGIEHADDLWADIAQALESVA